MKVDIKIRGDYLTIRVEDNEGNMDSDCISRDILIEWLSKKYQ